MSVNEFVLVRGLRDTRGALVRWNADPWPLLRGWFAGALGVAAVLLAAVWLVAEVGPVDISPLYVAGLTSPADAGDVAGVLWRNSVVLALHATACVAGSSCALARARTMPLAA